MTYKPFDPADYDVSKISTVKTENYRVVNKKTHVAYRAALVHRRYDHKDHDEIGQWEITVLEPSDAHIITQVVNDFQDTEELNDETSDSCQASAKKKMYQYAWYASEAE